MLVKNIDYLIFNNPDTNEDELCSVHVVDKGLCYIFYDLKGNYLDFKIEHYD
jgi:hypothetical protein